MTAVLLTIHTLLVIALVGVVLLQRSEGGALGMGGGGGGGMMSGRGAANALTRSTTLLAAAFFTTSVLLAITSDRGVTEQDILDQLTGEESGQDGDIGDIDADDIFDFGDEDAAPATDPEVVLPDPTDSIPGDDVPATTTGGDEPAGEEEPQRG